VARYVVGPDVEERLKLIDHTASLPGKIAAAEAAIDEHCGRVFDVASGSPVARTVFVEEPSRYVWVPDFVVSTAEVVEEWSGTAWVELARDTDYWLLPEDRLHGGEAWPVEQLRFEQPFSGRLRITALFGWPATPPAVVEATMLHAAKLLSRNDSPQGTLGVSGFGTVTRVVSGLDRDAATLLTKYVVDLPS